MQSDGSNPIRELMSQLSAEHSALMPGFAELTLIVNARSSDLGDAIGRLADQLTVELDTHLAQEEQELFPTFQRQAGFADIVEHFTGEHRQIVALRDELLVQYNAGADEVRLRRLAGRFVELVTSHMTREDMMLFPVGGDGLD